MLVVHAEVTLANLADGWFGPRRLDRRQRHLPHPHSVGDLPWRAFHYKSSALRRLQPHRW